MGNIFNIKIIEEALKIEEKMFNSIEIISKLDDFSDVNYYNKEIKKLMLFFSKEKILFSKIPQDINVYNYIFDILKQVDFGLKNEHILINRFKNVLYNNYLNSLSFEDSLDDDLEYYDDSLELKNINFIKTNLLAEYIRSFDGPLQDCSRKVSKIFNNIKLYNIFLNNILFELWINNNFDSDCISFYNDEEICKKLNLSFDDYSKLLNDMIFKNCANLLTNIFLDVKHPKRNIVVQDSFFNFKFLLKKISTKGLIALINEFEKLEFDEFELYEFVLESLCEEIDYRDDVQEPPENDSIVDDDVFNKIVNLVKFENNLFDCFMDVDFDSNDNNLKKLNEMVLFEKKLLTEIDYSSTLLTVTNDLFNFNIWIYLTGDVFEKAPLITQRLSNILPIYKDLKVFPSQSSFSYDFIYRNHLIRSLSNLWELALVNNNIVGDGLKKIYKYNFFTNPSFTDELLLLNGNHLLLFDFSSDLSGLSEYEFVYDQNELLYKIGCDVITYIFECDNNIDNVLDFSNFQFKMYELMDVVSNLSDEYNYKLYRFLMNNSPIFSPLRRDLRKLFKNNVKVKSINNY